MARISRGIASGNLRNADRRRDDHCASHTLRWIRSGEDGVAGAKGRQRRIRPSYPNVGRNVIYRCNGCGGWPYGGRDRLRLRQVATIVFFFRGIDIKYPLPADISGPNCANYGNDRGRRVEVSEDGGDKTRGGG